MPFTTANFRDRLLPITLGQIVGLLCGLGGVKMASRFVSPADYGAYGVFLSFTPLGMWVVHAGLIKFVARHWAGSPNRGALLREVIEASFKKLPWLALATLGAALAMNATGFIKIWPALFISASLLSIGLLAQTALQAERSHWTDFGISTVGSLSRSFLPPLLYVAAGSSLGFLETGFCAHTVLFASGFLYLWSRYKSTGTSDGSRQLSTVYAGQLFVMLSLAGWLLTAVNRWIVAGFFGQEKAGYFTLAGNLTQIATSMFSLVVVQYFQPGLFAMYGEQSEQRRLLARRLDLIAAGFCLCSLAGVVALHLIAPWLVGPLINEKYRPALGAIMPAGFFSVAILTAQFYHTLLLAGRRERACGPVDVTNALLLTAGGLIGAIFGERYFFDWLLISPLLPWLVTRQLARRYYNQQQD
ncbi:MAG: oligosaccharide flippase family protein [Nibricoccus sp.]